MGRKLPQWGIIVGALLCIALLAVAQRRRFFRGFRAPEEDAMPERAAEFHFLRVEYTDLPEFRRGFGFVSRNGRASGWWAQDWPDAENHFSKGVERLTRIDTGDPRHIPLTDDRIFDYPWIYATQTAYWDMSNEEANRLREYLLRGGFLVTDDFWGPDEWDYFRQLMNRVLPGKPIPDILPSDSVMHALYDIEPKDRTFIPGSRHLRRGYDGSVQIVQPPGTAPAWRALYDDKGRMVVAVNFDTDVGDAWEFADVPYYPEPMTELAYRYGINYLIYAMTH
ncbi:MAG TPA: DUF4159 domain-containing protein [Bryobacteraceae bacterium]|nr:DUF4159 domain-containing protein [Bryobacteraceae bacterium]